MQTLVEAKQTRTILKAAITRHETAISKFKTGDNTLAIESRLPLLNELFQKYNDIQTQIESLLRELTETEEERETLEDECTEERLQLEDKYFNIIGSIKQIILQSSSSSSRSETSSAGSTVINITGSGQNGPTDSLTNLKPIDLPTFSGDYANWFTFSDSFQALVHNDSSLSNIRKFHYLRGCLKDEALRAIESIALTNDNYESALDLLKRRFENKRLIVHQHVSNILKIETISKASHNKLRHVLDTVYNNIAALRVLQQPVDQWDAVIVPIICEKLDFQTKKEWQASLKKEVPTYNKFVEFLEGRCQILESLEPITQANNTSNLPARAPFKQFVNNNANVKKPTRFTTNVITKRTCYLCDKNHLIFQCHQFLNSTVNERIAKIEVLKLCQNCLRNNHNTNQCKVEFSCKICKSRHHTLLHDNQFDQPGPSVQTLVTAAANQIILSTISLLVIDTTGKAHKCRALLDQCSEVNIMTDSFCEKLGLKTNRCYTKVAGINLSDNQITKNVNLKIKSRVSDFAININCLILKDITRPTPAKTFKRNLIKLPDNIRLADPEFNMSKDIDILIGAGLFWQILLGSPVQVGAGQPFWQNTKFGWIIGGEFPRSKKYIPEESLVCNLLSISPSGNSGSELTHFWNQELINPELNTSQWTREHLECETHYIKNTTRAESGQFIVKLPPKRNFHLGNSKHLAIRQFTTLEKRFASNPKFKELYTGFMTEFLNLGHMEKVPPKQVSSIQCYYMPHHAVFKQTMDGPKIRVVFNAAAKSSNGLSLNDNLMTGPTIQEDIFSILTRFRTYQYAFSADINKMFRMVLVDERDRDYQRIIWRNDPSEPISEYRIKTVTYGTTCAPFLAVRCLFQLADNNDVNYPIASGIIKRDFYMDDLLTGSDSLDTAKEIQANIKTILASGGFDLGKWCSNSDQLIPNAGNIQLAEKSVKIGDSKLLGFLWDSSKDQLKYDTHFLNSIEIKLTTKRIILTTLAKIFDPLGLINPVVVKAKIIMQSTWNLKLKWDEPVPDDLQKIWTKYLKELRHLNECVMNRKIMSLFPVSKIELHGFSDASMKAYGAAIYLRTLDNKGNASVQLVCAKSRVAPLKTTTLPRLELNAALLLVRLMVKVRNIINLDINRTIFWTDSTIVLSWLNLPPNHWKQYVSVRVAEIQASTAIEDWNHVSSGDNPADLVSRGAYPKQLNDSPLWWQGPKWLSTPSDQWPRQKINADNINGLSHAEERKIPLVNLVNLHVNTELPILAKVSSFSKLVRIIAYCLKFIDRCKKHPTPNSLTVTDLNRAEKVVLKQVQGNAFSNEIKKIAANESNRLSSLDPFLDEHGLIRVGGRLKNAPIAYSKKYPIVLPEKHLVTLSIIREVHARELHAGNSATLAAVRETFWPLSARNQVKKIIRACIKCCRAAPKSERQKMGNIPKERFDATKPFNICGVDYGGPYLIKEGRTRSMRKVKAYIALFVCFSSKAVHLELVGDLTTESFVAALKRFIARRGVVSHIYSDNGTNFIGAERELFGSNRFQNKIKDVCLEKRIQFHFIPARSPHFGGLWERAIRSVKQHLRRLLYDASLTYEEFYTLLTSIEACLNSRPLSPLTSDPNDLEPLTPGHFLVGSAMTAPPEADITDSRSNRLSRWQRISQLRQHFWKRWHKEYLAQLQIRPKGQRHQQPNLAVGALVILVEDNLPPLQWTMGRVIAVHPGNDGIVRVVTIKTSKGVYKRAVRKVCALPTDPLVTD